MEGRRSEAWSTIGGCAIAGGLAGAFWFVQDLPFRSGELVALLFVSAALPPMIAVRVPLTHATKARSVAAWAAAAAVAGFFAVTNFLSNAPAPRESILLFLGLAPLVTALIAFAGAAYLARGIRRARERRIPRA